MSDKGVKKNGIASLRRAVKPDAECKAFFVGKWNAGSTVSEQLLSTVSDSITTAGGVRTKIRMFPNGLKVGDKGSIFSAFPEQFYPIGCIRMLKRDDKFSNAIIVVTKTVVQIHEITVFRCPTEYEARQFVESYDKHKVTQRDPVEEKQTNGGTENWALKSSHSTKKQFPRAVISTAMVNGINGHAENSTSVSKVTTDSATKTMHIQTAEPIYATVNKQKSQATTAQTAVVTTESTVVLTERIRALELENLQLREFIQQHLVTTYQPVPVKQTDIPVNQVLLLEGNRLKNIDDATRSETVSLVNSGQFERGSLQYQRRAESLNGYQTQKEVTTKFLVPVQTLRHNIKPSLRVERKIDDVYKSPNMRPRSHVQMQQPVYQDVAESLPPRDDISSLSGSDMEDNHNSGELFEITTPTPVRYM